MADQVLLDDEDIGNLRAITQLNLGDDETSDDDDEEEYLEEGRWQQMTTTLTTHDRLSSSEMASASQHQQTILQSVDKDREAREIAALQREKEKRERDAKNAELVKLRSIRSFPPGLKVFPGSPFSYFTSADLNLEKDFNLSPDKRDHMKNALEMNDAEVNQIFSDPADFILYLSPEASSYLVKNASDFVSICDFLFFSQMSSDDIMTRLLYRKALVDLLRNYDFPEWQLTLQHLFVVLLNLGANREMILDPDNYRKYFSLRIKHVEKWSQENGQKFRLRICKFPEFFERLCKERPTPSNGLRLSEDAKERSKNDVIYHFLEVLNEILVAFPENCVELLAPIEVKNINWINTLILLKVLATISTDHKLIRLEQAQQLITEIYCTIIESFTVTHWAGKIDTNDPSEPDDALLAVCDIVEAFFHTGSIPSEDDEMYEKQYREQRCWTREQAPQIHKLDEVDHHHNMVHRLTKLPFQTSRGRQVLKAAAFMHLQLMIDPRTIENSINVNMIEVWKWLESKMPKMKLLFEEHYLTLSIIRLLDLVAGNEPLLDFDPELYREPLEKTSEFLKSCKDKFLSKFNPMASNNDTSIVQEAIGQLISKWSVLKTIASENLKSQEGQHSFQ